MNRLGSGVVIAVTMAVLIGLVGCSTPKKARPGDGAGDGLREQPTSGGTLDDFINNRPPERGPLEDVNFDYDRYDLDDGARRTLSGNADYLKKNTDIRVEIEGHCDERGTVEYNLALGAKRAKAVRDYLASLGIESGRLGTISYGEELPLCRDANESCWARNRRGHFVVLK